MGYLFPSPSTTKKPRRYEYSSSGERKQDRWSMYRTIHQMKRMLMMRIVLALNQRNITSMIDRLRRAKDLMSCSSQIPAYVVGLCRLLGSTRLPKKLKTLSELALKQYNEKENKKLEFVKANHQLVWEVFDASKTEVTLCRPKPIHSIYDVLIKALMSCSSQSSA